MDDETYRALADASQGIPWRPSLQPEKDTDYAHTAFFAFLNFLYYSGGITARKLQEWFEEWNNE